MSRKALEWVLYRQLLEADEIVKRFEVAAKAVSEGKASGEGDRDQEDCWEDGVQGEGK